MRHEVSTNIQQNEHFEGRVSLACEAHNTWGHTDGGLSVLTGVVANDLVRVSS